MVAVTISAGFLGVVCPVALAARPSAGGGLLGRAAAGRVTGVDVSVWQHAGGAPINWHAVARHMRFVYIEATGGVAGHRSPFYVADSAAARRAGLAAGAYDLVAMRRPVTVSAQADARHFAAVVGRQDRPGTLPPALDVEINPAGLSPRQIVAWIGTWTRAVALRTGRTPVVYTYPMFWRTSVAGSAALSRRLSLWTAYYVTRAVREPTLPPGWRSWLFWQVAADNGRAQGIATPVDLDIFNGSLPQLNRIALRGTSGTSPAAQQPALATPLDAALYAQPPAGETTAPAASALSALDVVP